MSLLTSNSSALPLPIKLAMRWYPHALREQAENFLRYHYSIGARIQHSFHEGGGIALQNQMNELYAEAQLLCQRDQSHASPLPELIPIINKLNLRSSDFSLLMDGWNLLFIRQRYRDSRQRETILLQLSSKPLTILFSLADCPKIADVTRPFGIGSGMADMVRRFWVDLQQGRVYLTETEIDAHGIDLNELAMRQNSPQIQAALKELSEKARLQMALGLENLEKHRVPSYLYRSLEQYLLWQDKCLTLAEQRKFAPTKSPVDLGKLSTYRLFWFN